MAAPCLPPLYPLLPSDVIAQASGKKGVAFGSPPPFLYRSSKHPGKLIRRGCDYSKATVCVVNSGHLIYPKQQEKSKTKEQAGLDLALHDPFDY